MISKKLFVKTIEAMREQQERDIEVSKHLSMAFPNVYEANLLPDNETLSKALLKLLEELMGDDSETIEYFMYELDFGKEDWRLGIYDEGVKIPLSNALELYDYLKSNKK